jgi:hypothetical protein
MVCSFLSIVQKFNQKNYDELQIHPGFSIRAIAGAGPADARIHPASSRLLNLMGSVPRSALCAQPPENEFAFAKNPLAERTRGRPGHVVPLDVLNIAAAIADEVVMPYAFRIESRGAALDGHFTHQTSLHQVPQIVIRRGP